MDKKSVFHFHDPFRKSGAKSYSRCSGEIFFSFLKHKRHTSLKQEFHLQPVLTL